MITARFKTITPRRFGALALLSLLLLSVSCGDVKEVPKEVAKVAPVSALSVVAMPDLLKELRIGNPRMTAVTGRLQVAGRVEANESRQARISSPVGGSITRLEVVEGQNVKKGDLIAVVRSTALADAQLSFLKASSQRQLVQRAVERADRLLEAGVIGSAELQRRQADVSLAEAEYSSARDQLRVLGMSEAAIQALERSRTVNAVTEIYATISGTVMERHVTPGQILQAAEEICVIADLSQVWLVADVPEQSAGNLTVGKAVEAEIAALPGERVFGKLSFVSAIVNPETRTVLARMDLPNPDRRFKPSMLATMTLQDLAETQMVVPDTAVVRENNQEYVFLQIGPNSFVLHKVELGSEYGSVRVVTSGLQKDDNIVLDGAFHLNNERKRLAMQGS
jgi:cobalt-zinc-cadmium efflux system membrane fusion protein